VCGDHDRGVFRNLGSVGQGDGSRGHASHGYY
jgi:hypothetical protein